MTRDEYRQYLTGRIDEIKKTVFAVSAAQDLGAIGDEARTIGLELARQLDRLMHDLYYIDKEAKTDGRD